MINRFLAEHQPYPRPMVRTAGCHHAAAHGGLYVLGLISHCSSAKRWMIVLKTGMLEHLGLSLSIGEIASLARTPLGRRRLASSFLTRLAPLLRQAAWLHRRTLARKVQVVAVTGSFGKSTTVRLTAAVLGLPSAAAGLEIPSGLWPVPRRVLQLAPGKRLRGDRNRY